MNFPSQLSFWSRPFWGEKEKVKFKIPAKHFLTLLIYSLSYCSLFLLDFNGKLYYPVTLFVFKDFQREQWCDSLLCNVYLCNKSVQSEVKCIQQKSSEKCLFLVDNTSSNFQSETSAPNSSTSFSRCKHFNMAEEVYLQICIISLNWTDSYYNSSVLIL